MKTLHALAGLATASLLLGSGAAFAMDEAAHLKLGEMEYMGNCAACHGPAGKGDGPVAEVLAQKPNDLTQIAKKFGGTFPTEHIYHLVDGRNMSNPHGDRQMPVWGFRYFSAATQKAQSVPHDVDAQTLAHGRIMALVQYLESIQAK